MQSVLNVILATWLFVVSAQAQLWPSFSSDMINAIRSQRDLMLNVSIDQLPLPGVALKSILSTDGQTNNTLALETISDLLGHGIQTLQIDLSFDASAGDWLLNGSTTTFMDVLNTVETYLSGSNTNLGANILVILLRFDSETLDNSDSFKGANLTAAIEQKIPPGYIYSIRDLENDRLANQTLGIDGYSENGWVSLNRFLFEVKRRVVFGFLNGDELFGLENNSYIFPSNTFHYVTDNSRVSCPLKTTTQILNVSEAQWRFLEGPFAYENGADYVACGYSVVITNRIELSSHARANDIRPSLADLVLWSWNSKSPTSILDPDVDDFQSNSQYVAYRCGVFNYIEGHSYDFFKIGNCYNSHPFLCRYSDRAYVWNISKETGSYFDSDDKEICPRDNKFSIPRTPLQQTSLKLYLEQEGIDRIDFWIDINSVSVSNCWITGGPYASCPYQTVGSNRNFIAMTVPSAAVALVLFLVLFYFNWMHVPIQDNRNNWKRILNAYSKEEVDGVPS